MGQERLDDLKKEVRSVLISSKEGMTEKEFLKAYQGLLGTRFPSRDFGFTTHIELIESMSDVVCLTKDRNGNFVLTAIADKATEHIQKLVQKQKNNKKKPNTKQTHISNSSVQNNISSNSIQRNRPFVPAKLRAEILQILKKHPDGIGYTAFIFDYSKTFSKTINLEWLSSNPSERFRKLALAVPELEVKTVGNTEKLSLTKQFHPTCVIQKNLDENAGISRSLQNNFEKVLQHYPGGVMAVHFPILYQTVTGQNFDLHEYGFNSLLEMTDALPGIFVRVPAAKDSTDWILFHVDNVPDTKYFNSLVCKSGSEIHSKSRILCSLNENIPNDIALPTLQYTYLEIPEKSKAVYFSVYLSHINSPSHFWFQIQNQEAVTGLDTLEKEMQRFYDNLPSKKYKMADDDIIVGAACTAYYAAHQHWYRVVIAAIPSLDKVVVDFIDYGSSDQVPKSSLYYLKYIFIHLPAQALKAQLAAVKPANEKSKWTRETNKRFIDLCDKKFLMAQIKSMQNSIFSVLLCDTSGEEDIHINATLVKEGYAEYHRVENVYSTPLFLYLNTSESSSSTSSPLTSPAVNAVHINQLPRNGTRHSCCKRLFVKDSIVKQQITQLVKRIVTADDYTMHILLVEHKAYVSVGDLSNLFWTDSSPDLLLIRLKYKNVLIPTITISRDDFPELFEQCERFSVKDFEETKDSVTLFPLQFAPKIINILEHPSENIRSMLIKEVDDFCPKNIEWNKPFEEPEAYKECINCENKLDRLCLHDLKARQEALRYKRKMLLETLQEKWSDILINQIRNLDSIQNYITKRIKDVDAICSKYSNYV